MPLRDENRILVRRGLEALNRKPRSGLSELLQKANLLGKKLGAGDIAWQVTPVVNAAGRMGAADKAVSLFSAGTKPEREAYADEVIRMNVERRRLGGETWDAIYPAARESLAPRGGQACRSRVGRGL